MLQLLVLELLVSCVFSALGLGSWEKAALLSPAGCTRLSGLSNQLKALRLFISVPGLVCSQDCVDEGESPGHFTLGAVFALSWGTKAALSVLLYLFHPF